MSESRRQSSADRVCAWGKYAVGVAAAVVLCLVYLDLTEPVVTPAETHRPGILCERWATLLAAVGKTKEQIWDEWNVTHYPNFLSMMHIPQQSWDIQKAKFVQLLLEDQLQELAAPFVVGFSGSSVTAGHDNFIDDAYPAVFERTLLPVFRAMNKSLVVRNQAIGNNPCYPYDACVETHMGADVDLLTWEQSMNCGRNCRPLDTFGRAATLLPKRPTLVYLLSGGPAWSLADCAKLNRTATADIARRPPLTDEEKALRHRSPQEAARASRLMDSMAFLRDGPESLVDRFASLAPMAQSTFPVDAYRCLGPYNHTFSDQSAGAGAPWHPGKRAHRLRGHSLAFFLLAMLTDAAEGLAALTCPAAQPQPQPKTLVPGRRDVRMRRRLLQQANATVAMVQQTLQFSVDLAPAQAAHVEAVLAAAPAGADRSLLRAAVAALEVADTFLAQTRHRPLAPVPAVWGLNETAHRAHCLTDFEPRQGPALSERVLDLGTPAWTRNLSFFDVHGVEKAVNRGLGYLDRKFVLQSGGAGSRLQLRVEVTHRSRVWLCEVPKGFLKYPAHVADLPQGALVQAREEGGGAATVLELELLLDQCYRSTAELDAGRYVLSVTQRAEQQVTLAYVITW